MPKGTRREAMILLLSGVSYLGGCSITSPDIKPTLPEDCVWLEFPYGFACIDLQGLIWEVIPAGSSPPPEKVGQ